MTHSGKEALEQLVDDPFEDVDHCVVHAKATELCIIRAYVEALEVKAGAWDDHMEAEGAVLRDALEHPERHRLIGPSEIRNEALEEAAKVADDHTPPKHTTALASHVTGVTIAKAIRALKQ